MFRIRQYLIIPKKYANQNKEFTLKYSPAVKKWVKIQLDFDKLCKLLFNRKAELYLISLFDLFRDKMASIFICNNSKHYTIKDRPLNK